MPRGKRQGVQIFDERLGIGHDDLPVTAKGQPPDPLPGRRIHLRGHEFGDGPLPFPPHDEIDPGIGDEASFGGKRDMRPSHHRDQRGTMLFCRGDDLGGSRKIQRHGGRTQDVRPEFIQLRPEFFRCSNR